MLEWILILSMATLGAIAFAILFKAAPVADTTSLETVKLRHDLAKLTKDEQKKKEQKAESKKQKQKEEEKKKKKKDEGKGNRSPPKQRSEPKFEEIVEEDTKQIYIPNVPIQNNTPTTKPQQDLRSRSPVHADKPVKKEPVSMPSKKEIEKNLSQGFVVVQKKGPPPLTAEQKKERELLRLKEEEEVKRRESEALAREKEREKKRAELSVNSEVSLEEVKARLNKQKAEKQTKQEERKRVNCVVKEYKKMLEDAEETERRSWGATGVPEGEDMPAVDMQDYPSL